MRRLRRGTDEIEALAVAKKWRLAEMASTEREQTTTNKPGPSAASYLISSQDISFHSSFLHLAFVSTRLPSLLPHDLANQMAHHSLITVSGLNARCRSHHRTCSVTAFAHKL